MSSDQLLARLLTFEVEADDGPVSLGDLLADASHSLITAPASQRISGFAAHGTSTGDALAGLIDVYGLGLSERDSALRTPAIVPPTLITRQELGAGTEVATAVERIRASDSSTPDSLTVTYYEPDRDYQTGQMRASSGHGGTRDERIELPAVLSSAEAKRLAESAFARRWLAADRIKVQLPPLRMDLRPGDAIQLPATNRVWVVRSVAIEGLAVALEAEAAPAEIAPLPADPGRQATEPDELVGRSELSLVELPALGDAPAASPVAFVAASNSGTWKRVPVELTLGAGPLTVVALTRRAVLGRAVTVLDGRCPRIADELSSVTVELANPAQLLLNADDDALMAGANLATLGEELIQFGRAELLAGGHYRLSRLLRGRRGTEWATATHIVGEAFCLVDVAKIRSVDLSGSAIGAVLKATAYGVGDVAPLPITERPISGEAARPPSPCRLTLTRSGTEFSASWVRRSHRHWAWVDGVGDGADSFPELYRLTFQGPNGQVVFETVSRSITLSSPELPGQAGQSITLSIVTVGPAALSRPATITFTL